MSTLTDASTLAQVQAAYDNNASYYEDSSATKAGAFITACTFLVRRLPEQARHGEEEIRIKISEIKEERREAKEWLVANGSDGSGGGIARQVDLRDFRE